MTAMTLSADCARCAALCCVALAFDQSDLFGFDKAAGEPCPHLEACGHCRIHAERDRLGFGGCVAYDCAGAGQYVTQEMFGGRSWRDDPALLRPMIEAFTAMQTVHAQLGLLREARRLPLPKPARRRLEDLERMLQPASGWTSADIRALRVEATVAEVRSFLRSLVPFAAKDP